MKDQAKFVGIVNGRPRFEFGDRAPPKWLRELLRTARVDEDRIVINGKPVLPGTVVEQP
jgi:hypothetical protein